MEHLGQCLLRHHCRDHPEIPQGLADHASSYNQVDVREGEFKERAQGTEDEEKQRAGKHESFLQAMLGAVHSVVGKKDERLEGIQRLA